MLLAHVALDRIMAAASRWNMRISERRFLIVCREFWVIVPPAGLISNEVGIDDRIGTCELDRGIVEVEYF